MRATLLRIVDQAEALRQAANRLGDDLRAAAGAEKMPTDRGQRLGEVLVHRFASPVERILTRLQRHSEDAEGAEIAWRIVAHRLARDVAEPALDAVPNRPSRFNRMTAAQTRYYRALNNILGTAPERDEGRHTLGAGQRARSRI